jgi:hypothetical protein
MSQRLIFPMNTCHTCSSGTTLRVCVTPSPSASSNLVSWFFTCVLTHAGLRDGLSKCSWGLLAVFPSLFWRLEAQQASPEKCLSQSTQQMFFNLNGVCNIIQDVSMYLLPIPMLWGLQMPLRQKFALGTLLSIGLVAVAGKH